MKRNRKILSNCMVIHEGMQNVPDLKKELAETIESLQEILNNDTRHLSDVGLLLQFQAGSLKLISDKCFEAHAVERVDLTLIDK